MSRFEQLIPPQASRHIGDAPSPARTQELFERMRDGVIVEPVAAPTISSQGAMEAASIAASQTFNAMARMRDAARIAEIRAKVTEVENS